MEEDDDLMTEHEWEMAKIQWAFDSMSTDPRTEEWMSPEDRARSLQKLLAELQRLADRPQLRRRLGRGQVTAKAPYADSRRPTDMRGGYRIDNRPRSGEADRNYAAGLL